MDEKEKKAVEEYMKKLNSYFMKYNTSLNPNNVWFSYAEDKIYDEPKTFHGIPLNTDACDKNPYWVDKKQYFADLKKLYEMKPLDWSSLTCEKLFFSSPPDVFSLPPIPPQDPSTIAATMKQEWNL